MYIFSIYIVFMQFKVSKKIFAHIDCDCFFASCEILRNPFLKNKHVCVGSEIIIACSYSAKALWIKTWTPIWEAKKILWNNAYFFSPDHNYYIEISEKLMNYLSYNTLCIEPFSIDEAFCEITWLPELYKLDLFNYLKLLQKDILKNIWIPVSIWVSNTKIKAKIYSKINKPYGIYINFFKEKDLFESLPISFIPFIWRSYQEKLKYKAKTIYDFISLWFWELKKTIWKNATDLWLELVWVNIFVVKKSPQAKSLSKTRSFNNKKTSDYFFLEKQLIKNFDKIYEELTENNFEIKKVAIMLRDVKFRVYLYDYKFEIFTDSRKDLLAIVLNLFKINYNPTLIYRSTWIIFSDIKFIWKKQLVLWENNYNKHKNQDKIMKIINNFNFDYDVYKISYGFELLWKPKEKRNHIRF